MGRVLFKDKKLKRLVDADIRSGHNEGEVKKTILLALICTQLDPKELPTMVEVVQILEGAISLEKRWEESQNDSIMPTRQWQPKLQYGHGRLGIFFLSQRLINTTSPIIVPWSSCSVIRSPMRLS